MKKYTVLIFIVLLVYLSLRLFYIPVIDFSYDQPQLALIIKDFLGKGTFLTSQEFSQVSHWQYYSWGPVLTFFYSPFLYFFDNPMYASVAVGIFNVLSVVAIIAVGWKFFSPFVGIIAGIFLATHPWWVVFSSMLYVPTPTVTFASVSIYLLFQSIKKPDKIYIGLLIISWTFLIQSYLNTFAFIVTSFLILLTGLWKKYKLISKKHLLLGLSVSIILFVPSIYYYTNNPEWFISFFETPGRFTPPETSWFERIENVFTAFFVINAGGMFDSVLGYAYEDFLAEAEIHLHGVYFLILFVLSVLVFALVKIIRNENRLMFLSLLLMFIAPLWFLNMFWVTQLIPRYFLLCIPPLSLLFALMFEEFYKKAFMKNKKYATIAILPVLMIAVYWAGTFISYSSFLKSYSYPNGILKDVAEAPYQYLEDSVSWVIDDANQKGYEEIVLTNYEEYPNDYNMWFSTKYIWKYVFDKDTNIDSENVGYYAIVHSDELQRKKFNEYGKYGPFVALEVNN